jgi:hypothetical protein
MPVTKTSPKVIVLGGYTLLLRLLPSHCSSRLNHKTRILLPTYFGGKPAGNNGENLIGRICVDMQTSA